MNPRFVDGLTGITKKIWPGQSSLTNRSGAIGPARPPHEDQAQEAHAFIRGVVTELYDHPTADAVRILYGGSLKPDNIKGLMAQSDIRWSFGGGGSLMLTSFGAIVNYGS